MAGSDFNYDSSRIADANRSWQAACNTAVTGWNKSNEFIVALVANGQKNNLEAFKIQWSKNDVDWYDLTGSGELIQGTNTVLVNGNPVGSLCGCASATVEQSEELEGDSFTESLEVATTDNCIEIQVAIDPSNGIDNQIYYFRQYSITKSVGLGTAEATLTLLGGEDFFKTCEEDLGLSDVPIKSAEIIKTESTLLVDARVLKPEVSKAESFSVNDNYSDVWTALLTKIESFNLEDFLEKEILGGEGGKGGELIVFPLLEETLSISDDYSKIPNKAISEALSVSGTYSKQWDAYMTRQETIDLADDYSDVWSAFILKTESLSFADTITRILLYFKQLEESLGLLDIRTLNVLKLTSETIGLTDEFSRISSVYRTLTDSMNLVDARTFKPNILKVESFEVQDIFDRIWNIKRLHEESLTINDAKILESFLFLVEALALADEVEAALLLLKKLLTENLGLADEFNRVFSIYRTYSEAFNLTDIVTRVLLYYKTLEDSLSLSDTKKFVSKKLALETLGLIDIKTLLAKCSLTEALSLADEVEAFITLLKKVLTESLGLTDEFSDVWIAYLLKAESISLTDEIIKTSAYYRLLEQTLGLTDTFLRQLLFYRLLSDSLGISDFYGKIWNIERQYQESMSISDIKTLLMKSTLIETLLLADDVQAQLALLKKLLTESMEMSDSISKIANYKKTIAELLVVVDKRIVKMQKELQDSFTLADAFSVTEVIYRVLDLLITIKRALAMTEKFISSLDINITEKGEG